MQLTPIQVSSLKVTGGSGSLLQLGNYEHFSCILFLQLWNSVLWAIFMFVNEMSASYTQFSNTRSSRTAKCSQWYLEIDMSMPRCTFYASQCYFEWPKVMYELLWPRPSVLGFLWFWPWGGKKHWRQLQVHFQCWIMDHTSVAWYCFSQITSK